jgi:hypothetical protein
MPRHDIDPPITPDEVARVFVANPKNPQFCVSAKRVFMLLFPAGSPVPINEPDLMFTVSAAKKLIGGEGNARARQIMKAWPEGERRHHASR